MSPSDFPPELVAALRELERVLPLQQDLETTLSTVSEVSVGVIPGCDSASVTLLEDGKPHTPGASDDTAVKLDKAQYEANAGPCLKAIEEGSEVQVDDITMNDQWPNFRSRAVELGVLSSLSIPIKINDVIGGLNLYGRAREAFRATPRELTALLSSRASIAIENATVYARSQQLIEQLNEAIKTREIIGEAKGILMATEAVSEDDAFQMLVTVSQNSNMKLRDVAQKIVDRTTSTQKKDS